MIVEIILLIVALLMVAACAGFVAAEFSFITVSRSTVERAAAEGDRRAEGVLTALRTLSTQLSGAQLGITITNLAIGFLAEPVLATWLRSPLQAVGVPENGVHGVSLTAALILSTIVTMVFGELVPKNLAIAKPFATAKASQGFQRTFTTSTIWVLRFLNGTANRILRMMGIEPHEELASARSADELLSLVERSAEQGTLERDTARLLQRSLAFGERNVADVMTHRMRAATLPWDATITDVIQLAIATGHSRFPIIGNQPDEVAGVVHIRRAIAVPPEKRSTILAHSIMQTPLVVPELMDLDLLLDQLKANGLQLAVVFDEHGSFVGVATLEDLIEEIVGEVRDEHDEADTRVERLAEAEWRISGLLRPDEVASRTRVQLPEAENDAYETVAGLLTERLRRMPEVGDSVTVTASLDDQAALADLTVEVMDGFRIDQLHMRVTLQESDDDDRDRDRSRERERERDHDQDRDDDREPEYGDAAAPTFRLDDHNASQRNVDRMNGVGW